MLENDKGEKQNISTQNKSDVRKQWKENGEENHKIVEEEKVK